MRTALLFLAVSLAFAQPQYWDPGSNNPSRELRVDPLAPASGADVTDWKMELRMSGTTTPAASCTVFTNAYFGFGASGGAFAVFNGSNSVFSAIADNIDGSNNFDLRLRYDHTASTRVSRLSVWKADGTLVKSYSATMSDSVPNWDPRRRWLLNVSDYYGAPGTGTGCNFRLHFVRVARGLHSNISLPPTDTVSTSWDLVRLEFNGNTTDTAAGTSSVWTAYAGSGTYAASSLSDPSALVEAPFGIRSGVTWTVAASPFAPRAVDGIPTSCRWNVVSAAGPYEITTSRTNCYTLSGRGFRRGSVKLALTVSDGTAEATSNIGEVGIAPSDANGVVPLSANLQQVLRGVHRYGTNPWPGADVTRYKGAVALRAWNPQQFFGDLVGVGTVSFNPAETGPARLNGSGTTFRTSFACDGSLAAAINKTQLSLGVQAGYGASFAWLGNTDSLIVAAPVTTVGSLPGAPGITDLIYQVSDGKGDGVVGAACGTGTGGNVARICKFNGASWEYDSHAGYEFVVFASRSGDTLNLTTRGSGGTAARGFPAGSAVRAVTFVTVDWDPPGFPAGVGRFQIQVDSGQSCTDTYLPLAVYHASSYPVMTGKPYRRLGSGAAVPGRIQWTDGSYNANYYDNVIGFADLFYSTGLSSFYDYAQTHAQKVWTLPNDYGYGGAAPRVVGFPGLVWKAMTDSPADWGCAAEVASCGGVDSGIVKIVRNALTAITFPGCGDCAHPEEGTYEPREGGWALIFAALTTLLHPNAEVRDALYANDFNIASGYFLDTYNPASPRPRVHPGPDPYLEGMVWSYPRFRGPTWNYGAQPFMMAYPSLGLLWAREVALARGNTTLAANALAAVQKISNYNWNTRWIARRGLYYFTHWPFLTETSPAGFLVTTDTGCSESEATRTICSRALADTIIARDAWLCQISGEPYCSRAEEYFSAVYGGYPDDGWGGSGVASGPGNDGLHGEMYAPMSQIGTKAAKDWAKAAGATRAFSYVSIRAGAVAPQPRTIQISPPLSPVAAADRARVTLTAPDGTVAAPVTCLAIPCSLSADARYGDYTALIEYVNAGGQVFGSQTMTVAVK